ncbi:MAG: peptidase C45 [Crocinitomicaceae bacterium]|nr:peptidase C45 [Crocinitomicaceae bacterium]
MKEQSLFNKTILFLIKVTFNLLELILGFITTTIIIIIIISNIYPPKVNENIYIGERIKISEDHYTIGQNWLKKNEFGVWEMYIEGAPYERGLVYGKLAKELIQKQETIFVKQIDNFVPNKIWKEFLKLLINFFNKELPSNIPIENQQEIYGVSKSFSNQYDYIAPKYNRILNYHAAHDIGHALNDYSMIGCTSFAIKDEMTKDSSLIIGRNFDFFVGDDFAEEKLILIVKPNKGYGFISSSWPGFTGVVSGLNDQGISITINASKSDIPSSSKTPISILAREILQYSSSINDAILIAKKRKTFVSETILISSKKDKRAILIEKSPNKIGIYDTKQSSLICSNHYQSKVFSKNIVNIENIKESDSKNRYNRIKELLNKKNKLNIIEVAEILRDQKGKNEDTLGMGNSSAINQLIAHHSVIIEPEKLKFYVSMHDYQLGAFKGYDLNTFFFDNKELIKKEKLQINEDQFINSIEYRKFKEFKATKNKIQNFIQFNKPFKFDESDIKNFISTNGELYLTYKLLGEYFMKIKDKKKAKYYFQIALKKNVASKKDIRELNQLIKECY